MARVVADAVALKAFRRMSGGTVRIAACVHRRSPTSAALSSKSCRTSDPTHSSRGAFAPRTGTMRCLYNNARLYNSSPEEHPHDQTRKGRRCADALQAARNSPICASQRQASGSRKNDVCDRNGWSRTFSP